MSALILILFWGRFDSGPAVVANDPPAFISGTVTDSQSGQPIPDVNVSIVGTQLGRATDLSGNYFIGPLESGFRVVEFSHVAYQLRRDTLYFTQGDTLRYNVMLAKRSIVLHEVEIQADHPGSAQLWKGTSGRVLKRKGIEESGVRGFGELIRHMAPGTSVREMGPDLFIDLNKSSGRTTRPPARDYLQNTNPLIFLNGMKIGKSPQGLSLLIKSDEIDEIVVIKGIEAGMYGYEGRDGVILLETTPQPDTSGLSLFQKALYATAVVGAALLAAFYLF